MTLELLIRELAAQGTREALERHLPELLSRFTAPPDPDLLRSYDETAAYMGTTRGAVKALVDKGELWAVRIGNERRIPHQAVHEYLERERVRQQFRRDQKDTLTEDIPGDIAAMLTTTPSSASKAVKATRRFRVDAK